MAATTLTLDLDDGTVATAIVDGDIDEHMAALLTSGDRLLIRADDPDVLGHATTETLSVWVSGPYDVEGQALSIRLPNAQAARDLERKLIAGGAIALVVASGALVSQAVPGAVDPAGAALQAGAVHPGQPREHHRTDGVGAAPVVVEAGAVHPNERRDHLRTDGASTEPRAIKPGGVHPGQTRTNTRADG